MKKVSVKVIPVGILLGTSSLSTAHNGGHTELAPLHILTSLDHMWVLAWVAAGAVALTAWLAISHLRKSRVRNQ